ncbi:DUF2237 domain-containing protein [Algiphilus sp. NNCM1]|uniref:DUF2237 family protein n=1 Tax=Algiphilus sp. TaxID=1872431 RepID=UPI001CA6D134|nr:DUF2237 domain-containing protein [Algiphilus sp.]MBY8966039.1 DUF2237 domain-containing protein [Algiphilus acroporae]MCI5063103.1 DUF2237 domain-containing protein [Algiphilus sp.]MCI5104557.1 DUF2237 domain-containing protein [Algiphilus sp.]
MATPTARNVLGNPLTACCETPSTGFFRDGFCHTAPADVGMHTVCAIMTEEFLAYTRAQGNDLSTPRPEFGFKGLQAGDRWCLCAARWAEAAEHGVAPPVLLSACHEATLNVVELAVLSRHALQ